MTKEEKIKEAYINELSRNLIYKKEGINFYNDLQPYIDENGWINTCSGFSGYLMESDLQFDFPLIRLKSLQGIENNNGWIKLESNKDIPIYDKIHYSVFANNEIKKSSFNIHQLISGYQFGEITHYKPIINEKPIY